MNFETGLRVATLNVRGLGARRRQCQVSRLLLDHDLHLVAVQETKIESQEATDRMASVFRPHFDVCVCHAVGSSGGCALFVRSNLGICVQTVVSCESGRLLVVDFSFSGLCYRAVCAYAPNVETERKLFFECFKTHLNCEKMVLLLGDFNCVCAAEDRSRKSRVSDKSAELLSEIVHDNGLEDVGSVYSNGIRPTYTHFQRDSHARLDRIYVSAELLPLCTAYDVKPVSFSDHCLVMAGLGKRQVKSRLNWNLWKFNVKLLDDEHFVSLVAEKLEKLLDTPSTSLAAEWEEFKQGVKITAMERSSILKYEQNQTERMLREQLEFFSSMENNQPGTFSKELRDVKCQLEEIDVAKYKAAIIRARADKLWVGERPTKRALSDEKRYACQKEIRQIANGDEITSDSRVIKRVIAEHFNNLLGHQPDPLDGFQEEFLRFMPKLDDDVKARLEWPITIREIEDAIDELTLGKAPGPDGLGAAFYKTFKSMVAQMLLRVFVEAYDLKRVPLSFTTSHVVLIPKSDDPAKLQSAASYRPISLTNVDYKIFMKVLAKRLQGVITTLVGSHQTCGIKGRSIATNVHVARSVLECCDALGEHVAMMQYDLAKAFDRASHHILFSILEHSNVGHVILEGVRMAYSNCTTRIIVNGELTDSLRVRSSVRQGCPLSPLLFVVYLEPLCLSITHNELITGFRLQTAHVKILAYADDIAVFCSDRESIKYTTTTVERFCECTGAQINWDKSYGFWHGDWDATPEHFSRLRWSAVPTQYLGVPLGSYRDPDAYWSDQVRSAREKATAWQGRQLSIFSRATVCNLFLISKFWYVMNVLCASRVNIQRIHRVFAVFIWASTWERTSRMNLFRPVKLGGLGLAHLFLRQLVSRFIFLRDQNDPFLRTVMQLRLQRLIPGFIVASCENICGPVIGYLREVIASYRMLSARFTHEYLGTVNKKKLYMDLVESVLPVPLYRFPHLGGPGQDVLKRVKKMPVLPSVKTFFFKLHTNTLPVKTWLSDKGFFIPWTTNCYLCKKPETIEHVFLDCCDPIFYWDVLQRTLKKELPLSPYGIRFLPVDASEGIPYDLFMLLGLHALWRTKTEFEHVHQVVRPVRDHFIESVVRLREVLRTLPDTPVWISVLDELICMKQF